MAVAPTALIRVRARAAGAVRVCRRRRRNSLATGAALALLVATAAGCGSSDSTPEYCSDLNSLKTSVSDLPSAGIGGLSRQISTIKSDAAAVASSAQSDFPDESRAVRTSADALAAAVESAPSNPTAAQVGAIARDVAALAGAVNEFADAAASSCD
ncbi:MAG TPA: hypothetical protein VLK58_14110 [Conexibacter sp.]|nr:hypothetical protein [Conexibacter sp.]